MAPKSIQPLTEMSTRNFPGGKGLPGRKADNPTTICEPRRLTTQWASTVRFMFLYNLFGSARVTLAVGRELDETDAGSNDRPVLHFRDLQ
jgi:hypothetical protein